MRCYAGRGYRFEELLLETLAQGGKGDTVRRTSRRLIRGSSDKSGSVRSVDQATVSVAIILSVSQSSITRCIINLQQGC